jgi:RND superfamily putative drug exporter
MTSLTSRAGRWSARHRKLSIGGWLAFVAVAVVLGSSAGFVEKGADDGVGSSGRADRAVARAFPEKPSEQVLVEGREAVAADVLERVRAARGVESASVDRRNGDATLISVQLARERDAVALVKTTEQGAEGAPRRVHRAVRRGLDRGGDR